MRLRPILFAALLAGAASPAFAAGAPLDTSAGAERAQDEQVDERRPVNPFCLRHTGSRIKARHGRCLAVNGRVWTQEELRMTGQTDLGEALRMLDVSIR